MNHRELVQSGRKKAKFHFLRLPEALQDEIMEGLDDGSHTLESARDLLAERGYRLSHEAIAAYHRAVRRERRLLDARTELARTVEEFAGGDLSRSVEGLTHMLVATAAQRIADGEVGIRDVDLAKVMSVLATITKAGASRERTEASETRGEQPDSSPRQLDAETLRKIREEVYGIL